MKKELVILGCLILALGIMPGVFGLSAGSNAGGNATASSDGKSDCIPDEPTIYIDPTARCWEPNDETEYTAREYGGEENPVANSHDVLCWNNPKRGNYLFTGETLKYFVIVENDNGPMDINYVVLMTNGNNAGLCAEVDDFSDTTSFGPNFPGYNPDTMASFVCKLVVNGNINGTYSVTINASTGGDNGICAGDASYTTGTIETISFNPPYSINVEGSVDFGLVVPDSVASSKNSIILNNTGAVVLDTYIAASDYFTDPSKPLAICGDGNGIPYWAFSYYAMKGTVNSGLNNNEFFELGEDEDDPKIETAICTADVDEYTTLPSYSGRIDDMCRIINWDEDASLLTSGDTMSLLFQLDVPVPCVGSFTDGRFYFVGEVV